MANKEIEAVVKKVTNRYMWFSLTMVISTNVISVLLRDKDPAWTLVASIAVASVLIGLIPLSSGENLVKHELQKRENND